MKRDKKSLISYAAGYFDGEGCVYFRTRINSNLNVGLGIDCRNSDKALNLFKGLFGGTVFIRYSNRDKKCFFHWVLQDAKKIKKALKLMYPFLRLKKEQAEIGIRLCDRILVGIRKRLRNGCRSLSNHEKDKRFELDSKLDVLHHYVPDIIIQEELVRGETKANRHLFKGEAIVRPLENKNLKITNKVSQYSKDT